jgi:hypothetical protein
MRSSAAHALLGFGAGAAPARPMQARIALVVGS